MFKEVLIVQSYNTYFRIFLRLFGKKVISKDISQTDLSTKITAYIWKQRIYIDKIEQ